jgi:glycosyltransferase involved in cell wall biosynthesis
MQTKNLYFFTNHYPYGGESFVGNEVDALSKFYDQVFLFSTENGKEIKDKLAPNVQVIHLNNHTDSGKLNLLLSNFWTITCIFCLDLLKNQDKTGVFRKFRYNLSMLLNAIGLSKELEKLIAADPSEKHFVSFWMDHWALNLSILKNKKKIKDFVFRVHQHDLYIDEKPDKYIPFRFFNIKMSAAVFPDSNRGVNYLKNFDYFPEKIRIGHLGVPDKGTNPFAADQFVIVSCSVLIGRKRVDFIADVLKHVNIPVTWIHFGAKGEAIHSFDSLKQKCKELPENITSILKGDVKYDELLAFYKNNPVNLFVSLSRAEGLPVSVIEAVSFGIPVLATDIMGLPDVVTAESGILVSVADGPNKIAEVITGFRDSEMNTERFRKGTKEFWAKNFSADNNYKKFNEYLNSLN